MFIVPFHFFSTVDAAWLSSHGVTYANTPIAVSDPTAITTVQLIYQTVRAASQAEAVVRRGEWRRGLQSTPDVRDMTIGIIGMGTIGKVSFTFAVRSKPPTVSNFLAFISSIQLTQRKLDALGYNTIYHNRRRLSPAGELLLRFDFTFFITDSLDSLIQRKALLNMFRSAP